MTFMQQISDARRSVRQTAQTTPHIYLEWVELKHAEDALKAARLRHQRAKEAWHKLSASKCN